MTGPLSRKQAFDTAQQAFAEGWIDMDDLDRRLQIIANSSTDEEANAAIADLTDVRHRAVARRAEPTSTPARQPSRAGQVGRRIADGVLLLTAVVMVINVIIWGVVDLATGDQYFWPIWLLIPLGILAIPSVLFRMLGGDDSRDGL